MSGAWLRYADKKMPRIRLFAVRERDAFLRGRGADICLLATSKSSGSGGDSNPASPRISTFHIGRQAWQAGSNTRLLRAAWWGHEAGTCQAAGRIRTGEPCRCWTGGVGRAQRTFCRGGGGDGRPRSCGTHRCSSPPARHLLKNPGSLAPKASFLMPTRPEEPPRVNARILLLTTSHPCTVCQLQPSPPHYQHHRAVRKSPAEASSPAHTSGRHS